jgi:stage III sporulation protein SpoIIIAA
MLVGDMLGHMKRSLEQGRPESLLLLGRPGVGKTTLRRDVARVLSLDAEEGGLGLKVVVVDTSNEIAGDGVVPHECIGRARRMMVRRRDDQAEVLVEAVQNHSPDVVIVDEIGTSQVGGNRYFNVDCSPVIFNGAVITTLVRIQTVLPSC